MHFLLEAFITPFTIVLLLKNIFPLGGNNNLGTIIVIAAMVLIAGVGVVFATGNHTLFGRIVESVNKKQLRKNTFNLP